METTRYCCMECGTQMKCTCTGVIVNFQYRGKWRQSSGDMFVCRDCGRMQVFGMNKKAVEIDEPYPCKAPSMTICNFVFYEYNGYMDILRCIHTPSKSLVEYMEKWAPSTVDLWRSRNGID